MKRLRTIAAVAILCPLGTAAFGAAAPAPTVENRDSRFALVRYADGTTLQAASPARDFVITGTSAGRVVIGATKADVSRAYPPPEYRVEETDLLLEGMSAPAVQVFRGQELLLVAELEGAVVYRIRVPNPRYATPEGIRVGATLQQAVQQYGPPDFVGPGEEGVYAAFRLPAGTMSVRLDRSPADARGQEPAQSRIREILVLGPDREPER